jgi:hypothetical protein
MAILSVVKAMTKAISLSVRNGFQWRIQESMVRVDWLSNVRYLWLVIAITLRKVLGTSAFGLMALCEGDDNVTHRCGKLSGLLALWYNELDTISIIDKEWMWDSGTADEWYCVDGTGNVKCYWKAVEPGIRRPLILVEGISDAGGVTATFFEWFEQLKLLFPTFGILECRQDCWSVVCGTDLCFQLIFWQFDGVEPTIRISGTWVFDGEATVRKDGLEVDIMSMG